MLTEEQLKEFCTKQNIPTFRVKQILHAIYQEGAETFGEIETLPKSLRALLEEATPLKISTVVPKAQEVSADNSTVKILFELSDGATIEGVLMRFNDGRRTVCISSEVGCPLKCKFCASGTLTFKRSLTWEEMVDQVLYFARYLKKQRDPAGDPAGGPPGDPAGSPGRVLSPGDSPVRGDESGKVEEINHVVYMGIGEPFRNYDNLMKSLHALMDPQYLGLGSRKITVSTAGIADKIRQFADEPFQVNLALSLHAPTQELREKIMPIALRFKLPELMNAVRDYIKKTKRRVSFEYVMLKGVNDSHECAHELAKLIKGMLCHVNLIPYNATDIEEMKGSERQTIREFQEILNEAGVPATTRVSLGQDIAAACGQLANKAQKPITPAIPSYKNAPLLKKNVSKKNPAEK